MGRKYFKALIEPKFVTIEEAVWMKDEINVVAVNIGDEARIYPVALLRRHEVVNDVVGGGPVFSCFCMLSNLGAVYDCQSHEFTFGVSGYTYGKFKVWEARQAFVLWDRDTESLWWPPIGKAISGPMINRRIE